MTREEALKMAIEAMGNYQNGWIPDEMVSALLACKEALELSTQRNFCERCGKRASKDPYHIHTCTPPQEPVAWECFLDTAYYDTWAIRQTGNKNFEETIHVVNGKEAKHLCAWLNSLNTHPAPSWVELTDDEIDGIWLKLFKNKHKPTHLEFAKKIIDEMKDKNVL